MSVNLAEETEKAIEEIRPPMSEPQPPAEPKPVTVPRPPELDETGAPILNKDGSIRRKGGRPRKAEVQSSPSVVPVIPAATAPAATSAAPTAPDPDALKRIEETGRMMGKLAVMMASSMAVMIGGPGAALSEADKAEGVQAVIDYAKARNLQWLPPEVALIGTFAVLVGKGFSTPQGMERGKLLAAKLGIEL